METSGFLKMPQALMYILLHITLRFSPSLMISSNISFLIPDIRYVPLQDLFIDIDQLCWDRPGTASTTPAYCALQH